MVRRRFSIVGTFSLGSLVKKPRDRTLIPQYRFNKAKQHTRIRHHVPTRPLHVTSLKDSFLFYYCVPHKIVNRHLFSIQMLNSRHLLDSYSLLLQFTPPRLGLCFPNAYVYLGLCGAALRGCARVFEYTNCVYVTTRVNFNIRYIYTWHMWVTVCLHRFDCISVRIDLYTFLFPRLKVGWSNGGALKIQMDTYGYNIISEMCMCCNADKYMATYFLFPVHRLYAISQHIADLCMSNGIFTYFICVFIISYCVYVFVSAHASIAIIAYMGMCLEVQLYLCTHRHLFAFLFLRLSS